MKQALLVRTNTIGESEEEIRRLYEGVFGENIFYMVEDFSSSDYDIRKTDNIVRVGGKFLEDHDIKYFKKCGWQCGDYILYAAQKILSYDFFWLIEPDVRITYEPENFFKRFENDKSDLLAINLWARPEKWFWHSSMNWFRPKVHGMLFPFLRISSDAILHCREIRSIYGRLSQEHGVDFSHQGMLGEYANDEVFIATLLEEDGFSCRGINDFIENDSLSHFSIYPPIPEKEFLASPDYLKNKILHPVLTDMGKIRSNFHRYIKRYSYNNFFRRRMNEIVSTLGEKEWLEYTGVDLSDIDN